MMDAFRVLHGLSPVAGSPLRQDPGSNSKGHLMRHLVWATLFTLVLAVRPVLGYVEAPHTLGFVVKDSTNIVLMQVARVNKEKGLILYRKVEDLKGKHPQDEIKHNIGKRGFHPREWQNVMNWAEEGKLAVFCHNGQASETCIGTYWYQCYKENDWWGMSHAEPFLLRTFHGDIDKLTKAVKDILKNQEVIVTALMDGNKNDLHQRKGKLIRMRASLKRLDWNHKRDFVGFGGDGDEVEEFRSITLLAESSPGWRFLPVRQAGNVGDRWRQPDFDDRTWRSGRTPIGYGEAELAKRKGTIIAEQGQPFYFRRTLDVASDLLTQKNVIFHLSVASDDSADVWINGQLADSEPPGTDHEFAYWNRDVEIPARLLKPGRNVIAVLVRNRQGSSDLYLDMEITAQIPIPRPPRKPLVVASSSTQTNKPQTGDPLKPPVGEPNKPATLTVDKARKAVILPCRIAPRKLPNLNEIYPLEVVATYPAPRGQKAHETIVSFTDIRPGEVHKALESLGLKPGQPARGEAGAASGPEVRLLLEFTSSDGKVQTLPIEKLMTDRRNGSPLPAVRWIFTGSAQKQPDPEKDDKVYGADLTGTLISLFPVTDDTVFQSNLTMKEEGLFKLEVVKNLLPREGTPVKLIIQMK